MAWGRDFGGGRSGWGGSDGRGGTSGRGGRPWVIRILTPGRALRPPTDATDGSERYR